MTTVDLSPDLLVVFEAAVKHHKGKKYPLKKRLRLIGLYKQAREGPCTTKKPPMYQVNALNKWEAWKACEDLSIDQAMQEYITLLQQVDSTFDVDKVKIKSPQEREAAIELEYFLSLLSFSIFF